VKEKREPRPDKRLGSLFRVGRPISTPDKRRSKTSALHLGVWELYDEIPRITKDSVAQPGDVIIARIGFSNNQDSVGPKLPTSLKNIPSTFEPPAA